ncbi:transcription factor TFIIIC subunit tfc4 [Mortierella polycephala]|uniref:Transcription factor TFIIIC subunit tfc4 n=1 Tax=Mortierella polycephala TaxID=41804 RepID=A0A9P6PZY8_9FUNG|nr:transcription factor TFIIIC subunit tfc4 [Mortierella polycephala]
MDSNHDENRHAAGESSGSGRYTDSRDNGEGSSKQTQHADDGATPPRSNPLLTRLNQDSAERAHIAAVGNQLAPEDMRAPLVIGDFGGQSHITRSNGSQSTSNNAGDNNAGEGLDDALDSIRLGDDDDEFNELDADDGVEEDLTLNFNPSMEQEEGELEQIDETLRAEALSIASAVDPKQLMGAVGDGTSIPWDALSGFEPTMHDDDDELDENDPAMEELGFALQPKSKRERKKQQRKGGAVIYPPEIQRLLGQANSAYVNKDYKEAVELFQQVIVTHPSVFQAWNIMGVIQEELGNTEKALQLYLVAAHLTPKDGALWKKLAVISKEKGYDQQALYCFSRAYRADKNDMDALWDRSIMYKILEQPYKAIQGFQKLLKVKHHYMPALEELVTLYSMIDQDNKKYRENMHQAMLDYEAAYLHYSSLPDRFTNGNADPFDVTYEDEEAAQQNEPFGYSALNMLSELYIMFEEYEKPVKMIKTWSRRLQRRSHQTWWDDYRDDREFDTDPDDEELQASLGENRTRGLPVDLRVKLGVCRLMMEEVKEAKTQFKYLWRCSVEDFPDLYEEIAELYISKQMWKEGYNVIRAMLQFEDMDVPRIWIMAGECLRHMGHMKEAKDYLEQAHRDDSSNVEVSMMLAEVYEEMGNLPQALSLVNFVRQANADKQTEADRRRREAKQARDAKKDGGSSTRGSYAGTMGMPQQSYLLDPNHSKASGYRQLAPRGASEASYVASDAAQRAMARIAEASRDRTAAERYASADRDRDIQILRAEREHERAAKLARAERENEVQNVRDVIEKFNRLDLIFQRIDQKEKSRVWENKREAVKMTREDRTQYIQGARELINIFRSNKSFFIKERSKPYMGKESRTWRYRRNATDVDTVLSEHALEMSERLGKAMGLSRPKLGTTTEEASDTMGAEGNTLEPVPPTSYKEISFDAWYLLMIRQSVYLTYEDRYSEAMELLMVMFSANVFYQIPRRRSGIMLIVLACAMWVADYHAIVNAARWLSNFGGGRPLALKIVQATFTFGPRNNEKFSQWVQGITYKYLRRHIDRMRRAIGKSDPQGMRKTGRDEAQQARVAPFPWRSVSGFESPRTSGAGEQTGGQRSATARPIFDDPFLVTEGQASGATATADRDDEQSPSSGLPSEEGDVGEASTRGLRSKVSFAKDVVSEATNAEDTNTGVRDRDESRQATGGSQSKKRRLDVDDIAAREGGEPDQDEDGNNDELDDDDDDVNDELYRTDDDENRGQEMEADDYEETEWEEPDFPTARTKAFGNGRRRNLARGEDDDDDEEMSGVPSPRRPAGAKKSTAAYRSQSSAVEGEFGEDGPTRSRRGMAKFTPQKYPKFYISLVMFLGHVLTQSRTHVGAAAQFAECLDYAPNNPMIHFYLSVQFLNLAMQRTTSNRQMTIVQGLFFLQNYYYLRKSGRGTIAFSEREEEYKAKGKGPTPSPVEHLHSILGYKDQEPDWKAAASKASSEAISPAPAAPAESTSAAGSTSASATGSLDTTTTRVTASVVADVSSVNKAGTSKQQETSSDSPATTNEAGASAPAASSSSIKPATSVDPPLTQCQQEAEYNFARAFHQLGQNHLAMIHYRRVLELPSWREVEREHKALHKKQAEEKIAARSNERAAAHAQALERKMKRAQEIQGIKEDKKSKTEKARAAKSQDDAKSDVDQGEEQEGDDREDGEDGEDDLEMEDDDELDDEDGQGPEEEDDRAKGIQLQGVSDDDPTDLKREAAFNLAKVYMQSGAMGEAQLLMRKYCTL